MLLSEKASRKCRIRFSLDLPGERGSRVSVRYRRFLLIYCEHEPRRAALAFEADSLDNERGGEERRCCNILTQLPRRILEGSVASVLCIQRFVRPKPIVCLLSFILLEECIG